jgi:hypothetical protein
MDTFFSFFGNTFTGGLLCILVGIVLIYIAKKYPSKQKDAWFAGDLKGMIGGIGLILAGLLTLIGKIFNLLNLSVV